MTDARTAERPFNVLTPDACRCADVLAETDFRDAESLCEAGISGLCQYCQDVMWTAITDGQDGAPPSHFFLRRGLVFAHSVEQRESALIPFVFGAPGRPVGWDFCSMVRVGRSCASVDPAAALSSLKSYTLSHRLGVASVDTPAHPLLDWLRDAALVVGFQSDAMARFVDACPALRASAPELHRLTVVEGDRANPIDVPSLILRHEMDSGYDPSAGPPQALRLCAWVACALHIPVGDRLLLDSVLAPHLRRVGPAPSPMSPAPLH